MLDKLRKLFKKKPKEDELVIVGFISDEREPWYAKKSEVEQWEAEKMEDVI